MPAVKNVGEPCAREPHARFEVAAGGNQRQSAMPRGVGASRRPYSSDGRLATVAEHFGHCKGNLKWETVMTMTIIIILNAALASAIVLGIVGLLTGGIVAQSRDAERLARHYRPTVRYPAARRDRRLVARH